MTNSKARLLVLSGLSAASAYAAQPPDTVTSDKYYNTAMGADALLDLGNSATCTPQPCSRGNTAAGANALKSNTSGHGNAAFGAWSLFKNTTGAANTAVGNSALYLNTTGVWNTATGNSALYFNTTGKGNSAFGTSALTKNTTGNYNAGFGTSALYENTTGNNNAAFGTGSMYKNTTGGYNSAFGNGAMYENEFGSSNTALGASALSTNTSGNNNTAAGAEALFSNSTGGNNAGFGYLSLYANTNGANNDASGYEALYKNTTGQSNSAVGSQALFNNTSGGHNVAVGQDAGYNQTTGSNNIYISHEGVAAESGVTRIGTPGTQTTAFIAGIDTAKVTGSAVYVTSSGQLGVLASSERYKTSIAPMNATNTDKLRQLRPVSFQLKTDPGGAVQYGLIAEEVEKVYPELVIRDEAGKIQGVRYEELTPMLLDQVQRQQSMMESQAEELKQLQQKVAALLVQLHLQSQVVEPR